MGQFTPEYFWKDEMIRPETESELAQAIAAAESPLNIRGGGTRGLARAGNVLTAAGLSGVTLYEPGALTLVAGAGTPVAEIDALLAAEGQRLAFEPMDHRGLLRTSGEPTLGGVVAANISGPRRVQTGACRDFLLGVRFVDGLGQIIKNGGRVMKNVTGYDLVKLMAGSFGTLGVLTEVSFKVLPVPEARAVVLIEGLDVAAAVAAMSDALGSPFDVTGAAHTTAGLDGHPVTMIRLEGFEKSVTYRAGRLRDLLAIYGDIAIETDPDRSLAGWAWVRDVEPFHDQDGDVWRISCKPSDAPSLSARLEADGLLFDWGGGLIWALLPEGTDARARIGAFAGHATLVRASDATKSDLGVFQPQSPEIALLEQGLRNRFDPRGILNPGLMG